MVAALVHILSQALNWPTGKPENFLVGWPLVLAPGATGPTFTACAIKELYCSVYPVQRWLWLASFKWDIHATLFHRWQALKTPEVCEA